MHRYIYTGLFYLALPLILARLLLRGFRDRGYWSRWGERFGRVEAGPDVVWFHAVSVGEVQAAAPLVEALMPDNVLITTMTPTGSAQVRRLFPETVQHCYAPYDYPGAVNRFLDRVRPRCLVILETEIWPNIIGECHDRGIKVMFANLRLSQRSYQRYARARRFMASVLRQVDLFAVQGEPDARRLVELGAPPEAVEVTGSIKFEVELPASLSEVAKVLRREWGQDRPVWIAGSTHETEDEQVLDAYEALLETHPDLLLVLVPRHPERFPVVARLCRRRNLSMVRRSTGPGAVSADTRVYLGDTMGELTLMYAAADIAFVGGSLVPSGGHNILEPCALGVPVIFGPHMRNFLQISDMAVERGAGVQVSGVPELTKAVDRYLSDANLRFTAGENGRELVRENRGALKKTLEVLAGLCPGSDISAG
jgi:3-deoxy-D-manno-octulosonic-acid transferase